MICLEETHIKKNDVKYLSQKNLGEQFIDVFYKWTPNYIQNLHWLMTMEDTLEWKLIYKGPRFLLLGVYAPNEDKTVFYKRLMD